MPFFLRYASNFFYGSSRLVFFFSLQKSPLSLVFFIYLVSNSSDSRADPSFATAASAASQNKVEFDVCKNDWLAKHSKASSSVNPFEESSTATAYSKSSTYCSPSGVGSKSSKSLRSSKTTNSSRSSKPTALSVKRVNV